MPIQHAYSKTDKHWKKTPLNQAVIGIHISQLMALDQGDFSIIVPLKLAMVQHWYRSSWLCYWRGCGRATGKINFKGAVPPAGTERTLRKSHIKYSSQLHQCIFKHNMYSMPLNILIWHHFVGEYLSPKTASGKTKTTLNKWVFRWNVLMLELRPNSVLTVKWELLFANRALFFEG